MEGTALAIQVRSAAEVAGVVIALAEAVEVEVRTLPFQIPPPPPRSLVTSQLQQLAYLVCCIYMFLLPTSSPSFPSGFGGGRGDINSIQLKREDFSNLPEFEKCVSTIHTISCSTHVTH